MGVVRLFWVRNSECQNSPRSFSSGLFFFVVVRTLLNIFCCVSDHVVVIRLSSWQDGGFSGIWSTATTTDFCRLHSKSSDKRQRRGSSWIIRGRGSSWIIRRRGPRWTGGRRGPRRRNSIHQARSPFQNDCRSDIHTFLRKMQYLSHDHTFFSQAAPQHLRRSVFCICQFWILLLASVSFVVWISSIRT